jgi:hypothetical protein
MSDPWKELAAIIVERPPRNLQEGYGFPWTVIGLRGMFGRALPTGIVASGPAGQALADVWADAPAAKRALADFLARGILEEYRDKRAKMYRRAAAPVQVIAPNPHAPPITTQAAALSPAVKKALHALNAMTPTSVDERGRPTWTISYTALSDDKAERAKETLAERLEGAYRIGRVFTRFPEPESMGDFRYELRVTARPEQFAAYLAYPDRNEIKATQEAVRAAKHAELADMTPEEREIREGRDRNVMTDFTIRTCPDCFRDIKATGRHHTIVDHGFNIRHGYRHNQCDGVERLPFERSPEGTRARLVRTLAQRDALAAQLHKLQAAPGTLTVEERVASRRPGHYGRSEIVSVKIDPDDPRYNKALRDQIAKVEHQLRLADRDGFPGWRYLAVLVRDWRPGADDRPAVGLPYVERGVLEALTLDEARAIAAG